jgi:hypothetical protein
MDREVRSEILELSSIQEKYQSLVPRERDVLPFVRFNVAAIRYIGRSCVAMPSLFRPNDPGSTSLTNRNRHSANGEFRRSKYFSGFER